MIIHHKTINPYNDSRLIVTIGTFDGVHLGHRAILKKLTVQASKNNLSSALLTFSPHPRTVLQAHNPLRLLNTLEEKKEILANTGLDHLFIIPFTRNFSRLKASEFVREILVSGLGIRKIVIGYDHRFGRNRTANIDDLREYGELFDFEVEEISVKEVNNVAISSTKIRRALEAGNVKKANTFLGYPYRFSGLVKRGRGMGKTLGFPTANIHVADTNKLIPADGVYWVQALVNDQPIYGMLNIGNNPTIKDAQRSIEVYLLDFDQDLYGKTLTVEMLQRLRDEIKFESLEQLKKQLKNDLLQTQKLIDNYRND